MMNIQQKRDLLMSLPLMEQEQRWIMERLDTLSVKEQYQLSAAILRTGKLEELAGKTGWELQTAILHMDPKVAVDAVNCLLSLEDYQICFPAGSYAQLGSFYLTQKIIPHARADRLTDFLEEVKNRARYHYWLFGHLHDNQAVDKKHILLWEQVVQVI